MNGHLKIFSGPQATIYTKILGNICFFEFYGKYIHCKVFLHARILTSSYDSLTHIILLTEMKSFITSIGALLLCAGTRITSVLPSTSTSISSLTVVPSSVKRSANSSICSQIQQTPSSTDDFQHK